MFILKPNLYVISILFWDKEPRVLFWFCEPVSGNMLMHFKRDKYFCLVTYIIPYAYVVHAIEF